MSMDVRYFQTIEDNKYKLRVVTENFSDSDLLLMDKYGEPEIDLGGTFDPGGPDEFTLTSTLRRIKTGFPVVQVFDGDDFANAEDRALIWITEILVRINAAMTTLRTNTDDFSSETVVTV